MKSLQMALFVIGAAGFGRRIGWKEESILPSGHKLTFKVRELDICSFLKYSRNDRMLLLPCHILQSSKLSFQIGL